MTRGASDSDSSGRLIFTFVISTQSCLCITFVTGFTVIHLKYYLEQLPYFYYVYLTIATLASVSLVRCCFSHPGPFSDKETSAVCPVCRKSKLKRVHHCKTCGKCILLMDHHCSFVNNCIGRSNHKFFILFCSYTAIAAYATVCLAALTAGEALANLKRKITIWVLSLGVLASGISLFFYVLICILLVRQIGRILRNQTYIEEIKSEKGPKLSFSETVFQVFGYDPPLVWLLPIAPSLGEIPDSHLETSKVQQVSSKWEDAVIFLVLLVSLPWAGFLIYLGYSSSVIVG